jgi:hypothetical protein
MGDEMPADPFREGQPDWGPLAANDFAFFSAHMAAGFTEAQALELTSRYLAFALSIIYAGQAQQPEPGPDLLE